MIKIIVQRNGEVFGASIIATKNAILNPYFLFGEECKEDNQERLQGYMDEALDVYSEIRGKNASKGGVMPEYTLRTILLWQHVNFNTPISYPEIGCIPGIQSFLMVLFAVMNKHNPEKELIIHTVSTTLVRMSQLLVVKEILDTKDIQIYDTATEHDDYSEVQPARLEHTLPDDFMAISI